MQQDYCQPNHGNFPWETASNSPRYSAANSENSGCIFGSCLGVLKHFLIFLLTHPHWRCHGQFDSLIVTFNNLIVSLAIVLYIGINRNLGRIAMVHGGQSTVISPIYYSSSILRAY